MMYRSWGGVQRGGSLKANRRKGGRKQTVRTAGRQLQINVMEINIHTENNILISSSSVSSPVLRESGALKPAVPWSPAKEKRKTQSTPDVAGKLWRWRANGKQTKLTLVKIHTTINTTSDRVNKKLCSGQSLMVLNKRDVAESPRGSQTLILCWESERIFSFQRDLLVCSRCLILPQKPPDTV